MFEDGHEGIEDFFRIDMEEERINLLSDIFKAPEVEYEKERYFKEKMRSVLSDMVNKDVDAASTRLLSDQLKTVAVHDFVDS